MPNEAIKKLQPFFEKKDRLSQLIALIYFDIETCAPEKAIEKQSDLCSFYEAEYAAISKDPDFIALVKEAKELGGLNDAETLLIDDLLFDISVMEKISIEKYIEWSKAISKCDEMWKKAKNASDWNIVLPYFKEVVNIMREQSELYRLPFHKTKYDAFLSQFEKGQTEEDVNRIFEPLKKFLVDNLDKVIEKQSKFKIPEIKPHSRDEQAHLSDDLLRAINYDLTRGVLRETEHPFTNDIARDDCRVTTHYYEEDWRSSMYSVIHEGVRMPLTEDKHAPVFGASLGYGVALSKLYLGGVYAGLDFGYRCRLNPKTAIALVAFGQFQQAFIPVTETIEGNEFTHRTGRSLVTAGLKLALYF